jgi:hypothetical protein
MDKSKNMILSSAVLHHQNPLELVMAQVNIVFCHCRLPTVVQTDVSVLFDLHLS